MARSAISKKLRFDVFKRDGFVCQYCGVHPPNALLHCDHIQPVAGGGQTDIDNLITACSICNIGKGATPLSIVPQGLAERAADTAEREAQIAGYSDVMEAKRERVDREMWRVASVLDKEAEKGFDKKWLQSIKRFIERLGVHEVIDAAEIADAKKPFYLSTRFRYFCGICWKKITDAEGVENV